MPPERSQIWQVAAIGVAVVLLWNTPIVWPLKEIVVFFHELSHGLMAIITGGRLENIQIVLNEGGLTTSSGGNQFLIASAGYLGSLLWGIGILMLASQSRNDAALVRGLGILMVAVTILFLRNPFGFFFGLMTGALLIAGARRLPDRVNDLLLKTIGIVSCVYVIPDIWSDTIAHAAYPSDARILAQLTHIPTMVWGVLWIAVSVTALIWAFRRLCL